MSRPTDPDLLALAEDVAAGRLPMADAEARLTDPGDVTELRSLVRAVGAVRAHAEATRMAPPVVAATSLDVARGPVRRQPVRGRSSRSLVGGLALGLAAVVVVGVVAFSLGGTTPIGPAASPSPAATPSSTPGSTPNSTPADSPAATAAPTEAATAAPTPIATAAPTPAATSAPATAAPTAAPSPVAAEGLPPIDSTPLPAPNLAFWTVEGETIHILIWDPMTNEMAETATVDTWTGDTIERTVLFAPNGAQFAVHEIDVTTSSPVQRLRVFAYGGELRWEAPRLTYVTAMAWSPDGTALAIGSLPIPWTVVQFGDTTIAAEPDVTTYQLDDQDGYALLGFSEDANTLYGYGTGGEAEYWEKLVALDRATGRLTQIDSIPPGATALSWANSTAPVDRFHPDGSIITRPGGARGDPTWALRTPGVGDVPIAVDPETVLTWGPDRQLVGLGTGFVADDGRPSLRLDLIDPTSGVAAALPQYAFPAGDYRADLRGARDGHALVLLAPSPSFTAKEAVVIELATGRAAVGLPPATLRDAELRFGGWLGRRD